MNKNEIELRDLMLKNARLLGTYKGLLEGLMCQSRKDGDSYTVDASVFEKVKNSVDKLTNKE